MANPSQKRTLNYVLGGVALVGVSALLYEWLKPKAAAGSTSDTSRAPSTANAHQTAVAAAQALMTYVHAHGCAGSESLVRAFQTAYNADPSDKPTFGVDGKYDTARPALSYIDEIPRPIPTCAQLPDFVPHLSV